MATIPSASGLTTSQYLRYLQALSLWNNLQENQRRNYPSVGEMYAYQFPAMLNTLGKQVGDVFAAQGRDQQAAANLANTQSEIAYRDANIKSLEADREAQRQARYVEMLKNIGAQKDAAAQRGALGKFISGSLPQAVPGQTFTSMEEQPPESYGGMGAEPPVTAPQTTTTPSTTTQPTFAEAMQSLSPEERAYLPQHILDAYTKSLTPSVEKPPMLVSPGQGVRNPQGGYDVPIPRETPEKAPPAPTRERNLYVTARAKLMKANGGVEPTADEISAQALKDDEAFQVNLAKTKGVNAQDLALDKEFLPNQRALVVNQYGQPVQGSVTQRRINEEGLTTLRGADAQAIGQVAMLSTPLSKMLDAIDHGKFPQATGGSVYDFAQAYKSGGINALSQYSDPEISNFIAAQQNILFPILRLEGGNGRQNMQELQRRQASNPELIDTDVSAAAKAEQLAEIIETRLKAAGLVPAPDLKEQLDRAHDLAAKINARVSANQQSGGSGLMNWLTGGGTKPTSGGKTITLPSGKVVTVGE